MNATGFHHKPTVILGFRDVLSGVFLYIHLKDEALIYIALSNASFMQLWADNGAASSWYELWEIL